MIREVPNPHYDEQAKLITVPVGELGLEGSFTLPLAEGLHLYYRCGEVLP